MKLIRLFMEMKKCFQDFWKTFFQLDGFLFYNIIKNGIFIVLLLLYIVFSAELFFKKSIFFSNS